MELVVNFKEQYAQSFFRGAVPLSAAICHCENVCKTFEAI